MRAGLAVEAVRQLVGEEHTHHLEELEWIISIMCSVILLKLLLWLFCRRFESVCPPAPACFPLAPRHEGPMPCRRPSLQRGISQHAVGSRAS